MFLGGQTVILGNIISLIGRVSIVVFIGLSVHDSNDRQIITAAPVKHAIITMIQKSLTCFLEFETWKRPWIVEVSRNSLKYTILFCLLTHPLQGNGYKYYVYIQQL